MRIWLAAIFLLLAGCTDGNTDDNDSPDGENTSTDTTETLTFSDAGTILIGTQGADSCGLAGTIDTATFEWNLPDGQKYRDFEVLLTMGTTGLDLDLFVDGPSGNQASTAANVLDGSTTEMVVFSGLVTPGTYTVTVIGCASVAADFTVDGTVEVTKTSASQ